MNAVNEGELTRRLAASIAGATPGKSDLIDAENAARAVVAGTATATPKCAEGTVEMICHTKIARDTTVKFRTQAMVTLKPLIVTVPDELREQPVPAEDGPHRAVRGRAARLGHHRPGLGQAVPAVAGPPLVDLGEELRISPPHAAEHHWRSSASTSSSKNVRSKVHVRAALRCAHPRREHRGFLQESRQGASTP
ncbi:hypothetical protein [Streptomyces sp. NPDC047453]|uniref:hypothetical protein n=1 Tax=Streptomyces sp. NPDC047453 TaxID=3154812 RepID=UPI0033F4C996